MVPFSIFASIYSFLAVLHRFQPITTLAVLESHLMLTKCYLIFTRGKRTQNWRMEAFQFIRELAVSLIMDIFTSYLMKIFHLNSVEPRSVLAACGKGDTSIK